VKEAWARSPFPPGVPAGAEALVLRV